MNKQLKIKTLSGFQDSKKMMKTQDLVFVIMIMLLGCYYFFMFQRGIGVVDESFYFTIPHRMMKGDGLIVDEWQVSQFSAFLQYIPFRIYYLIKGSTEGIILYFRYLYILLRFFTALFLYTQMRKEGWISLWTVFLYAHYAESGILTLSYNSFGVFFLLWTSLLLFCGKPSRWKFLAAGVTVSGMVLAQPLSAFIYFLYSLIVLYYILTKKEDQLSYLFNIKSWAYMTSTIIVCASLVLGYIFAINGFMETISSIPYFFTDSEYVFPLISEGEQNLFDGNIFDFLEHFGLFYIWVLVILLDRKRLEHRKIYLAVSAVLMIVMYIWPFATVDLDLIFGCCRQLPMMFFAVSVFLLLRKKDKRWFAVWITALFFSIIVNISADYSYLNMMGSICSNIAGAIFVRDMYRELREEKEAPAKKFSDLKAYKQIVRARLVRSFCSVILIVIMAMQVFVECSFLPIEWKYLPIEGVLHDTEGEKLSVKCEEGPMKNLYTTPEIHGIYSQILDDMDIIKQRLDGPVYVYGLLSWAYLYLDKDYSTYSAWFVEEDFCDRQTGYFDLHPDKFPEYVYIPKYDGYFYYRKDDADERLSILQSLYRCEVEETDAGYIVRLA